MAMYKEMPESFESIWEKTRVFLAGFRSVLDGGKVTRLDDVPEEREAPVELPAKAGDATVSLFRKLLG